MEKQTSGARRKQKTKNRKAGVLLPVFSLPGKYGIGSFGKEARAFLDGIAAQGFTVWQVLPLTPTGYGDSPYQAFSTFAGNPYLIDLDELVKDGYLTQEELDRDHAGLPHQGFVIRSGVTGRDGEHKHIVEYSLKLDSNPEFTASVLLAYARAAYRLNRSGDIGCKTVLDIAPSLLSPKTGADLIEYLL